MKYLILFFIFLFLSCEIEYIKEPKPVEPPYITVINDLTGDTMKILKLEYNDTIIIVSDN